MKTMHELVELLKTSRFNRTLNLLQVEYKIPRESWKDPNFDQIVKDIAQARAENKELDIWVEGYLKRNKDTFEWIEYHEVEIPF